MTKDPDQVSVLADVHQALFAKRAPDGAAAKTLDDLKQGIRQRMRRRYRSMASGLGTPHSGGLLPSPD